MAGGDAYAGLMLTRKSVVFRKEFPNAPSVREKGARRTKFQAQKCRGVAQPGRASGSGPEGRWFESSRPDYSSLALTSVQARPEGISAESIRARRPDLQQDRGLP